MTIFEVEKALDILGILDRLEELERYGGSSGGSTEITSILTNFLGLTDTPNSYLGQSGKSVVVNGDESGLEFVNAVTEVNWGDIGGILANQTDLQTVLDGKSNVGHTHDDRYYTETEIDTLLAGLSFDHGDLTGLSDDDHLQYFNQTRGDARYSQLGHIHDDRYYTEAEINSLISGYQPLLVPQSPIIMDAQDIGFDFDAAYSTLDLRYLRLSGTNDPITSTLNVAPTTSLQLTQQNDSIGSPDNSETAYTDIHKWTSLVNGYNSEFIMFHNVWNSQQIDRWGFRVRPLTLGLADLDFSFGYKYAQPGVFLRGMGLYFDNINSYFQQALGGDNRLHFVTASNTSFMIGTGITADSFLRFKHSTGFTISQDYESNTIMNVRHNQGTILYAPTSAYNALQLRPATGQVAELLDAQGTIRCDELRIDQSPTVGSITPNRYITMSANGTTVKIAVEV